MAPFIPRLNSRDQDKRSHQQRYERNSYENEPELYRSSSNDRYSHQDNPDRRYSSRLSSQDVRRESYEEHEKEEDVSKLGFWNSEDDHLGSSRRRHPEDQWQDRQSPMTFALAIAILVVLSASGWFLYRWLSPSNTAYPPVLTAEEGPFKVRPETPGGMMIPHQDKLVYGRLTPESSPSVEHLLPPPEQPMMPETQEDVYPEDQYPQGYSLSGESRQQPYQPLQKPVPQNDYEPPLPQQQKSHVGSGPLQQQQQQLPQQRQVTAPYAAVKNPYTGQGDLPTKMPPINVQKQPAVPASGYLRQEDSQKQKKVPVISDSQPVYDSSEITHLIEQESRLSKSPVKERSVPKNQADNLPAESAGYGYGKSGGQPFVAPTSTSVPLADGGKFMVQIAAVSSHAAAEKEWKRLKAAESLAFKDKAMMIQKIERGNKSSYRVLVGPFSSASSADQFNKKLKNHRVKGVVMSTSNG